MKKLAIVGTHPETREKAPFDDPQYEIWVFNEAPQANWCRRYDAVFQLHKREVYESPNNHVNKTHWGWLQQTHEGKTIWMQAVDERVPASKRYPLEEILEQVPGAKVRWAEHEQAWFDSSGAYALALALYLGYEEIHIYGMDLVSNTEYAYQLPNWNYWVGVANGMGVHLTLHCSQNDFGNGHLYAYEGEIQLERALFSERARELEAAWQRADGEFYKAKDRLDQAIYARKVEKIPELAKACQAAAIAAGEVSGALAEANNYALREDPITAQEFEKRSAAAQRQAEDQRALMYNAGGKVEYIWTVWQQTGRYEAQAQLRLFLNEQMKLAYDMGARAGIYRENNAYMVELNNRITAAGGKRTLKALERAKVVNA